MAFQLSPGVLVTEKDLTTIVPAVATSAGGMAGTFAWGPAEEVLLIDTENLLKSTFHEPDANTYEWWFTAANFLQYGNNLQVVRTIHETAAASEATHKNATAGSNVVLIKNRTHYDANYATGQANVGHWAAKYPGALGNSLKVAFADAGANASVYNAWTYAANFDDRPATSDYVSKRSGSLDELHVIVIDEDGLFTGTAGTVLERYPYVSKASDARKDNGEGNYYVDVINNLSKYIYWMDHAHTSWGAAAGGTTFVSFGAQNGESLTGGVDANNQVTAGDLNTQISKFANADEIDIQLFLAGPGRPHSAAAAGTTNITHMISNISEGRKDCIVFLSPEYSDVVNVTDAATAITNTNSLRDSIIGTGTSYTNGTSYGVMDGNWKYQYDRYNDVFRWIPMNGDTAGLCVRTDNVADPWFSPAGFNRGQVKNVIKLAYQPSKAQRDTLYKKSVNPVITFAGEGTVLFGDKTMMAKPSAFDRINVRRLFLVLEKSIAIAAKYSLFEFNDEFTRAQFRNMVEPFLRDIQSRRGIFDFKVVCDTSNNTPEVIDRNEFIADIYVKPARSINYIFLNFVATRTGVSFEEVGG